MAKTLADLRKSRLRRQELKEKYGGEIPESVWVAVVDRTAQDDTPRQTQQSVERHLKKGIDPRVAKTFGTSGMNVRDGKGTLSKFPANICRRVVQFYSEPGDIVLDPCAGHNSRMQVTFGQDRNYIGYDVCHEFMEFNRELAEWLYKDRDSQLLATNQKASILLHEQSSEQMEEADNTVDLVFTSPPYWDVEFYDDNPSQLGYKKTYEEFLDGMQRVGAECFRVLKPGKLCVFNVADFRKDRFYMYHADLVDRFLKVGFALFDVVIMIWSTIAIRSMFADVTEKTKVTGKTHEYILVFKKQEKGKMK